MHFTKIKLFLLEVFLRHWQSSEKRFDSIKNSFQKRRTVQFLPALHKHTTAASGHVLPVPVGENCSGGADASVARNSSAFRPIYFF